MRGLTELETRAREGVESLYRHARLKRAGGRELPLLPEALFSREEWKRRGLTITQRLTAWAGAGATTGGVIDLGVGGASFFAGALVGGAVGLGVGLWREKWSEFDFAARWSSKDRKDMTIGPVKDPEFPVVLFNRALAHYRLVRDRAHGRRDELRLQDDDRPLTRLPEGLRASLMRSFKELIAARGDGSSALKARLVQDVEKALVLMK